MFPSIVRRCGTESKQGPVRSTDASWFESTMPSGNQTGLQNDAETAPSPERSDRVIIELPKAFSARHGGEIALIQDLMRRLNPKVLVIPVATGAMLMAAPRRP